MACCISNDQNGVKGTVSSYRRGRDRRRSPAWGAAHRCRVPRHRQSALILAPARSACRSRRVMQPHATEDARRTTHDRSSTAGQQGVRCGAGDVSSRWDGGRLRKRPGVERCRGPSAAIDQVQQPPALPRVFQE
ncbi:hypothetical protein E1J24_20805 [Xanthomonas hortorum pv. pelargonii]|uniref:Uncharacterized protein n=1 Tax=Xanthomonas hortorum pv. pelargonii TaxID=453602 RepID=A0AAW9ZXA9_9XANT|nr:hypothetical protein [Xanthomonas hortorum pv. pelargonii]